MQLKKLPLTESSLNPDSSHLRPTPEQEAEYLRHKYLGLQHSGDEQRPLGGFGGAGRPAKHIPEMHEDDMDKFWAQMIPKRGDNEKRMLKGGHGVPLSSEYNPDLRSVWC
jgi:saccharopepsin